MEKSCIIDKIFNTKHKIYIYSTDSLHFMVKHLVLINQIWIFIIWENSIKIVLVFYRNMLWTRVSMQQL